MSVVSIISEGVGLVKSIFSKKEPTPAEQKAKAGTWYNMLYDLVKNRLPVKDVASKWKDSLPFGQKSTKKRFAANFATRTYDEAVSELVQKINDELVKGGFSAVTMEDVLVGMGVMDPKTTTNTGKVNVIDLGTTTSLSSQVPSAVDTPELRALDAYEARNYLLIIGAVIVVITSVLFLTKPKTKRK